MPRVLPVNELFTFVLAIVAIHFPATLGLCLFLDTANALTIDFFFGHL